MPNDDAPSTSGVYIHTREPQLLPHMDPKLNPSRRAAHKWMDDHGWDAHGRIEIPVTWGEQDIFRHINNVHYARFVESSRMHWLTTLAPDLGHQTADALVNGSGLGIILKDQTIRFRAPVQFPDSLIWATKPVGIDQRNARFVLTHAAWSVNDQRIAATAETTIVMFDYNAGGKGVLSDDLAAVLRRRGGGGEQETGKDKAKAKL